MHSTNDMHSGLSVGNFVSHLDSAPLHCSCFATLSTLQIAEIKNCIEPPFLLVVEGSAGGFEKLFVNIVSKHLSHVLEHLLWLFEPSFDEPGPDEEYLLGDPQFQRLWIVHDSFLSADLIGHTHGCIPGQLPLLPIQRHRQPRELSVEPQVPHPHFWYLAELSWIARFACILDVKSHRRLTDGRPFLSFQLQRHTPRLAHVQIQQLLLRHGHSLGCFRRDLASSTNRVSVSHP
mmetsp:Transcript_11590/g.71288  ORF Transcript_11590/g.71288 Transcript_11590/m.71288 type:complete len:233 (-) Transcript_11590:43-741(-)